MLLMSRKTRQEKIIADLRKRLNARIAQSSLPSAGLAKNAEPAKIESNLSKRMATSDSAAPAVSVSYIKKDLTKTAILTILAISLELVLYFLFRVGKL